jgi:DNA-binding NtrC family response regulator
LSVLKSEPIDVILCGVSEWDTKDFTEMIETYHNVPVILSSATLDTVALAEKDGAYSFLQKPFVAEQLLSLVKQALDRSSRSM